MQRISRIATYLPLLLLSALTARADVKKPVFEEQKIGDIFAPSFHIENSNGWSCGTTAYCCGEVRLLSAI